MFFSIIIPVYNSEKYISECIDSILLQTHQDWEAICINDGSTDLSGNILDLYAKQDSRIRVYHKTNGGASSARNYALSKISSNVWVSFVDADDYLSPTMYEDIALALENSDVDYIRLYCNETKERFSIPKGCGEHEWKILTKDQYFYKGDVGGFIASLMVKSSIIKNNSLVLDENLKILEDQLFSIQCALCCESIMLYYKRNYFYYSNPDSITKTRKDSSKDIIRCINELLNFIDKKEYFQTDPCISDYIYKKWLPAKLCLYINTKFRFFHTMTDIVELNPKITVTKYLPLRYKIKYYLLKLLKIVKLVRFFYCKSS